jgi:thiol-disulfide isomerase/thioredoxin
MRAAMVVVVATALASSCKADQAPSGIEFVVATQLNDVAPWIASEVARAKTDNKRILVYVGAPWCEPCETFHRAATAGKLTTDFPNLRLLAFDSDRDTDALTRAGYGSEMIPLFAEPRADGQASGRKIMGSVKGEAAIANIVPRLKSLLAPLH